MSSPKTETDPFPRGYALDLPVRPAHLLELDWMADQRNAVRCWVPENVVCANLGIIVMVIREDVDLRWSRGAGGVLRYVLDLPGRCRVEAAISGIRDGVEVALTVTNLGETTWERTTAGVCAQLVAAPDFRDFERERTFLWRRGHRVLLEKGFPRHLVGPGGADYGFIGTASRSGRYVVGTGWEAVSTIVGNDEGHISCIHANPAFGDVAPGASVARRGRVYLMRGTPEDALARYREDFPTLGIAAG